MAFSEYLKVWLEFSALGIILGIFPFAWQCSAQIIQAAFNEGKSVPKWMLKVLWPNSYTGGAFAGILPKRFELKLLRIGPIIWVLLWLIGYHYVAMVDYARGNVIEIILIETSFPLVLLATWLLPAYFLRRYLRKLKPSEVEGGKVTRELVQESLKHIKFSSIFIILSLIVVLFLIFWGHQLTLGSVINVVLSSVIFVSLVIWINVKIRQNRNNTKR